MMKFTCGLTFLFAALSTGCGGATDEYPDEPVAGQEQEIWGGGERYVRGVVALSMGCSGILINNTTVLTAAHCAETLLTPGAQWVSTNAVYKRGPDDYVCLMGGAAAQVNVNWTPTCAQNGSMEVSIFPTYGDGNTNSDIAVLHYPWGFTGVGPEDFSLIDVDTLSNVDRLEKFGYGYNSYRGTGLGILRSGTGAVVRYTGGFVVVRAQGARTCGGDSGGPASLYGTGFAPNLHVAALHSWSEHSDNGECATEGGEEFKVRLSGKIDWINSKIGNTCQLTRRNNRNVRQCW